MDEIKENIIDFYKEETQYMLNHFNISEIHRVAKHLCNIIHNRNNIFISGVGKSGNIADYICGILQSINIPIYKMNLLNSSHGDIGLCKQGDAIIFLSNSGNTSEIIDKLHCFKQKSVHCNNKSLFMTECDDCITLPLNQEYPGVINTIPTSSILAQVFFGCILCDELMKMTNITLDEYKQNHSAGNIGKTNMSIQDAMLPIDLFPIIRVSNENPIDLNYITTEMLKYLMGICVITNKKNKVIGIITDGDIRRKFLQKKFVMQSELNTDFYYETDVSKLLVNIKNIQYIPIVQKECIIGMIKRI